MKSPTRRKSPVKSTTASASGPARLWLVKQEPADYSWQDFVRDGGADWTGVRNYAARLNLRGMGVDDSVLFYHSGEEKAVVGIAQVEKPAFPDPTAEEPGWVAVRLKPVRAFARPVTLAAIKAEESLQQIGLVRQSRLSVMPLQPAEFAQLTKLGGL